MSFLTGNSETSCRTSSFMEEAWFEHQHILIEPDGDKSLPLEYFCNQPIDIGIVEEEEKFYICIYNAHRDGANNASVTVPSGEGITVIETTPPGPTESQNSSEWLVCIEPVGDSDANYSIVASSEEQTASVEVTGERLRPWPFRVCWNTPPTETFRYCTDIIECWNKTEQRMSLKNRPDYEYNAFYIIKDCEVPLLDACIYEWQGGTWGVPNWGCPTKLDFPITQGDTVIPVDTTTGIYEEGGLYSIWYDSENVVVGSIVSVDPGFITVGGVTRSFPECAYVMPATLARMSPTQNIDRLRRNISRISVSWDALDARFDYLNGEPLDLEIWNDYPVLDLQPDWSNGVRERYERIIDECPVETTSDSFTDRTRHPCIIQSNRFCFFSEQELWSYMAWYHQFIKGRWGCFWKPNFYLGMCVEEGQQLGGNDDKIIVKYSSLASAYSGCLQRSVIRIRLNNGTNILSRVLSIVDLGNGTEEVTVEGGFFVTFNTDDVACIEFVSLCRFETDALTIRHLRKGKATINQSVRIVPLQEEAFPP